MTAHQKRLDGAFAEDPPSQPQNAEWFSSVQARGSVDHLLRTIQQHHVHLSVMADTKAGLVITIASIVLTVTASHTTQSNPPVGLLVLAAGSMIALCFAIFAVLPRFTRPDKESSRRAPLFFGGFGSLSEEEFFEVMENVLRRDPALYQAAIRDIYQLGRYLYVKKYRYVRYAFLALLSGFVAACLVQLSAYVVGRG